MNMKRTICFLLCCTLFLMVQAQRITCEFDDVSMSEALRQLTRQSHDYTISFLYNELEDFRVTTSIQNKTLPDAIRQMIGFYPVRVTVDGREIIVECPQKTASRYKGTIIDELGEPVAYANVALLSPEDSTLLTGGVSNESGLFVIPCEQHPVLARISYVGYKTIYKPCHTTEIGAIQLQPDNIKLKTIRVTGNIIQNTASGYKVYVHALPFAKDKMLTELLPYLPGISIYQDQITILGHAVTAYYIDGVRQTDPAVLKSLSTDKIESIEVDYVAGADEAKSAVGGIIRITTRREANGGFSGNVIGALTLQPSNGISGEKVANTLSASVGKLYVFNSIGFTRHTPKIHEAETYMPKPEGDSYSFDRQGKYKRWYLNEYLGLSYEFNKLRQLKGSVWYVYGDGNNNETGLTTKADGMHNSVRQNPNQSHLVQGVADYTWKPKSGQQFDFMVDYLYKYQNDRQHYILDNVPVPEKSQVENTHMLRIQPKWQQPLSKSLMLTTGLDYQQTYYDNDLLPRTIMNSYAPAAFAKIKGSYNAIQYDMGLRAQHTNMQVKEGDVKNIHNDFGIYPTINLMWMMNPERQHLLNFMYKYSMEDLPYSVVSSYRSYTSPYSYETGNPELKAPTGHELMLMASLWGRLTLTSALLRANDEIYFVSEQSPESLSITQIKPYNCAYLNGLYLGMEYLLRVKDLWTSKPRASFRKESGEVRGVHYNNPFCWAFDWRNDFRFSSTFSGELNFHYEPTSHFLDLTLESVYHLSLQLKKSFYQERFLMSLEAMPFFKNRRAITDNLNVRTTYHNQTKEQYLLLSATWRFKGGKSLKEQSTANSIQSYKQFEKKQ